MSGRLVPTGTDVVRIEVRDRVGVITLNRPERRNALHHEMYAPMLEALDDFADAADVGCVVLTGAGSAFCAGGDVRDGRRPRPNGAKPTVEERARALLSDAEVAARLHEHPKVTVAAINGSAVGAGLSLALACDLRIVSASAKFITGWSRLGFSGDFGGTWFLTRAVGRARALELLVGAEPLTAAGAAAEGLVNRVVLDEDFDDAWWTWACEIAEGPQQAIAMMKRNVVEAEALDLRSHLAREAERQVACSRTADHREAVRAWLDGRSPRFGG